MADNHDDIDAADSFGGSSSDLDRQAAVEATRDIEAYEQELERARQVSEGPEPARHLLQDGGEVVLSERPYTSEANEELAALATSVASLYLSDCSLETVPPIVRRMPNLKRLALNDNPDIRIPIWFWELPIEELQISGIRLQTLPDAIRGLRNLRWLDAGANDLRELPRGLADLADLQILDLGANKLSVLPRVVFAMKELRVLRLNSNDIAVIPASVGSLTHLQELDLSANAIKELPLELGELPDSINLRLDENELDSAADAFVDDIPSLLRYVRSLRISRDVFEAKMMLVGEGNVGKTTLLSALREEPFEENRPTTHGIELNHFEVEHPNGPGKIQLNTWDFGGQEVYRITHQFFFTKRALYLLVWKPREGQEENSIDGWCRRLKLRVGSEARIIVVATHADERRAELDFQALERRYGELLVDEFSVDSESGSGFPDLIEAIAGAAAELPQMGMRISTSWLQARDELLTSGMPQTSRMHLERIASKYGIEEGDVVALASLFHDLGYVIHYGSDEGLNDVIVLQPEWLTKAIGCVLEDGETRKRGGIVSHSRLTEIWTSHGYSPQYHRYFLRLMEKFDVSYRLPDQTSSLVAQLVPYRRPRIPWTAPREARTDRRTISVVCHMSDAAPGLVAWLTVRNHRFSTGVHWRHGVFLRHVGYQSEALLELSESGRDLRLTVSAPAPDYFYNVLKDSLDYLIDRRWPGLRHEFRVPCLKRLEEGGYCGAYFGIEILQRLRARRETSILCHSCGEYSDVELLLTGFEATGETEASNLVHMLEVLSNDTRARLDRIEAVSAESAQFVRRSLKLLSVEVADCPRLFTVSRVDRGNLKERLAPNEKLRLTLWCEEPGEEHPLEPPYTFNSAKDWLRDIAPYARVISRVIRVALPIASAAYAASLAEQALSDVRADLTLMERLATAIPAGGLTIDESGEEVHSSARPTALGNADMRHFRRALFDLDPSQRFCGLSRMVGPAGDFRWVCAEHKGRYDPGLPELPLAGLPVIEGAG